MFKGEFYQLAEQLDRELNDLWERYPSLMPTEVRWFRLGQRMMKGWVEGVAAVNEASLSVAQALAGLAGPIQEVFDGFQNGH